MRQDGYAVDEAIRLILREMRATPCAGTGKTPFNVFFGREMKGRYMLLDANKEISSSKTDVRQKYNEKNVKCHAGLRNFPVGSPVFIRNGFHSNFTRSGRIVRPAGHGSWVIRFENNRESVVNQRFIRVNPGSNNLNETHESYDLIKAYEGAAPREVRNLRQERRRAPQRHRDNVHQHRHNYNLRPRRQVNYRV